MNKTVTANISGIVFHIEVEAYEKLSKYLKAIRSYFQGTEGEEEIMADIEARIAELFKAKEKDVVNMQEVNQVIETMGEPEQYMDEEKKEEDHPKATASASDGFKTKKFFRDPDDGVFGGVCSGLGYYFGVDRIWFRAAFLIALFAGFGTGLVIYIILWVIVPSPKNTAEKLEMKGEPVNVSNIGNSIKEEFDSFKKKVDEEGSEGVWHKVRNTFLKVVDLIGRIIFYAIKFAGKALALLLLIATATTLLCLVSLLFSAPFDVQLDDVTFQSIQWSSLADLFFHSLFMFRIFSIGLFLFIFLPLVALAFICFKVLFRIPYSARTFSLASTALWVIAVIAIFIGGTWTVAEFSSQHKVEENIVLEELDSDTLRLEGMPKDWDEFYFISGIKLDEDHIYHDELLVDVFKSETDQVQMRLEKCARGRNREMARDNAKETELDYELIDNRLTISPFWKTPKDRKFRAQEIEVHLELPVGKTIYLAPSSKTIIYDIKNVSRTYDGDMLGHHWLMTEDGLECTDCSWLEDEEEDI